MPFSPAEIEAFREAARISARARDWATANVKPGVLLTRVQEGAEEVIRELGGAPSFPAQTSRNHIAAHYCSSPSDGSIFQEGDLVKVDVGAHVEGYPADTGVTVDLSPDRRWGTLVRAASDALDNAIAALRDGVHAGQIGAIVEQAVKSAGFSPIANLSGHGLARWSLHAPPSIPNVAQPSGPVFRTGMVFAIEPFATTGQGLVRDDGRAEVFSQSSPPRLSNRLDPAFLADLEAWHGLPIARRYFRNHPQKPIESYLKELLRQGALHAYRPLVEVSGGMVAWKEHTIYLAPDGAEVLTT